MRVIGMIEKICDEYIEGWAMVCDNKTTIERPKIELKINNKTVAVTYAVRVTDHEDKAINKNGFRFLIKDLFNYLDKTDQIKITSYDNVLPIYEHGLSYVPKIDGLYTSEDLFCKLSRGYKFDINGELNISLRESEDLAKGCLALYNELKQIFKSKFSYDLYLCYGTLLGVVRDDKFINNDGNFDCAYISRESLKSNVIEEFKHISRELIILGCKLNVFESYIEITSEKYLGSVNIYSSWLDESSMLQFSFAYKGDAVKVKRDEFEMEIKAILGYETLIPKFSEVILTQLYSEDWIYSDYGFKWNNLDEKVKFLNDTDMNEIYWEQYYFNVKKQDASPFCSYINDFMKEKYLVLDIGCGSGRDSLEFSKKGHHVVGLDKSSQAIGFANSLVKELEYENISFDIADVSNKDMMLKVFKKSKEYAEANNLNIAYYSRFFLHSINDEEQAILLEAMSECLDKDDIFIAEFRTKEDEERQKVFSDHYRRFVDEENLIEQLDEVCGMKNLMLFQKGTGFSVYKDEDPFLARVILGKG